MGRSTFRLPYFDFLIEQLEQGNSDAEKAFGRHVHWGYWEKPEEARRTTEDFSQAAETLCRMVCDAAGVGKDLRICDVGCGFGGTIASLNERFSSLELVGVNIDRRQLNRARKKVKAASQNKIEFVNGDACHLPFKDSSFDVVLAVECIFHFPDRELFFKEASRVLKPGGRLSLSDFVPSSRAPDGLMAGLFEKFVSLFYGRTSDKYTREGYRKLAHDNGFSSLVEKNITKETMPTYPVLLDILKKCRPFSITPRLATLLIKWAHQSGQTRYEILSYEKKRGQVLTLNSSRPLQR